MTGHEFGTKSSPSRHTTPATLESGARAHDPRADWRAGGKAGGKATAEEARADKVSAADARAAR